MQNKTFYILTSANIRNL